MREKLIETMKLKIEASLKTHLQEEGITLLRVAANDNVPESLPSVCIASLTDETLEESPVLCQIRLALEVWGNAWECDALVDGLYQAVHPHHVTLPELNILLMSLHVETRRRAPCVTCHHAVMRYVVEA